MAAKSFPQNLQFDFKQIAGIGLVGVGMLDLGFGATSTPLLPAPLANALTDQIDWVLIAAGVVLLVWP
jgi:hypothetical protein